ncbi:L,D-transpeptidase family protein [Paracoccus beibuensis]|uniref:L,D-transpeptidase family protein n=1 Tax=Paracoccus beibuensis TaxID=547602 RepID=UPI00223FF99A|nr:L,D-transpeptidase family protein [Paracoccus beibuensis]
MERLVGTVLALMLGVGLPGAVHAQDGAASVSVAASPKLRFSQSQMALAHMVADDPDLAAFYGGNGLMPIFLGAGGAGRREALLAVIADMPRHGIPSGRYMPDRLAANPESLVDEVAYGRQAARLLRDLSGGVLTPATADPEIKRVPRRPSVPALLDRFEIAADPAAVLRQAAPRHPAYLALQNALSGPAELTVPSNLPKAPEAVWRPGMRGEGVIPLRSRLAAIGFRTAFEDPTLFDAALSSAVADYQRAAGLPDDGIAGPRTIGMLNGDGASGQDDRQRAILVALERMRWMAGEGLAARHVWVNIPEFSTVIVDGGSEVFRTRSVMGRNTSDMRTPEFSEMMSHLVVNPSWNVPRSITVRDYLPKLQANRNAVGHLDVLDGSGRVVSRNAIDFSRYTAANFPFRLRQKPSGDNALGIVKFIFPNPWNIYLHDTPSKHLFANRVRAESNGCIRIGDPVDLARALLSRQTDDPAAMFQRAMESGRETWLKLQPPVPVHLVYFTAWPDASGQVRFFPDIYGRDARIWQALEVEGVGLSRQGL